MRVNDLPNLLLATGRGLARRATRMRTRDAALVVMFVAVVLLAYREKDVLQRMAGQPPTGGDSLAHAISMFANACGSGMAMTVLGVLVLAVGMITKSARLVDTALVYGAAGAWCFLFTVMGQLVFAEARPLMGGSMHYFVLHGHGVSGHASAAMLLAWPVHDVLARDAPPRVRMLATALVIAWALFVGWTRVYLNMHHAWNVLLGLALGYWSGRAACVAYAERWSARSRPKGRIDG